ncbi:protein phosphatase 1L-like isoform X7 [Odontomachus brunneus]|uniref:protein phosphatase 1L-like isoform X7 n=1 Tax=Odontomachus brunneus TaxID=486640 RepID=UPI0013F19EF0|nr:protein phosphatase 1L-like isoform X7 [Odontomachus brunneus]
MNVVKILQFHLCQASRFEKRYSASNEQHKLYEQTYVSHMKIASKFTVAVPTVSNVWFNTLLNYIYKFMQVYALKPEVLICGMILVIILIYVQAVDVWSRSLLARIHYTLGRTTSKVSKLQFLVDDSINNGVKPNWELKEGYIAAYAMQGHRARMEDRFVVNENMNSTGVSLFAVFDGHGGEARLCRPDIKQILKVDTINYIEGNKINYGKLITDEILTADKLLVEAAKKNMDVAGIYLYIYRVSQTTRTTQFFRKTQYFRKKCFQKKL